MTRARYLPFVYSMATILTIVSAQQAKAQLIVGQDGGGTNGGEEEFVYYLDIGGGSAVPTPIFQPQQFGLLGGPDGMAVDEANRIIYFCEGSGSTRSALYGVHFDDLQFDFSGQLRVRKLADIRNNVGGSLQLMNALAWDPVNSRLIASDVNHSTTGLGEEGFWVIDVNTGTATPLYLLSSTERTNYDFRGLEYNSADGLFYAVDEATAGSFSGLVSIDLNGTNAIVNKAAYPAGISDVDGLAVGNDKAYYIKGDPGDIGVRNLGTLSPPATNEANISALPWTTNRDNSSGGWAPTLLNHPAGSNLGASLSAVSVDVRADVELGSSISYSFSFANFGPSTATNVSYEIVLSGTASGTISGLSSSSGLATEGPSGTISGTLPSFPTNVAEVVNFTVTTTQVGTLTVSASIDPGANTDGFLGNNSDDVTHVVRVFPDVKTIAFAETPASGGAASLLPDNSGLAFQTVADSNQNAFYAPWESPKGQYTGFMGITDLATDRTVLLLSDNGNFATIAREGVTTTNTGETFGSMVLDQRLSINDSGQVFYPNDMNGGSLEALLKWNGTNWTTFARQFEPIPALASHGLIYTDFTLGVDSPSINGNGDVAIRNEAKESSGSTTAHDVLLAVNSTRVLAMDDVDIPAGLAGTPQPWENMDEDRFYMDCTGVEWLAQGDVAGSTSDDVLVVNGTVVLQQGQAVASLAGTLSEPSTTAGIIYPRMVANGDWYVRGTTSQSDQDFILKGHGSTYSVVTLRGEELIPGSGEHWNEVSSITADSYSATFMGFAANSRGDVIVMGRTDNPDVRRNTVALLIRADGSREVVLRENDPIDLNSNGQFDDDRYIRSFEADAAVLTDDGVFMVIAWQTDGSDLSQTGTFVGKSMLKIQVATSPAPTGADIFVDKRVDDDFLESVGQQATFSIRVCNRGPEDATNIVLNDPLPAGLTFVSATNGAAETSPGSNVVTATIANLPSCNCEVYDVVVAASNEGVFVNTASASSALSDPNNANNSGSATVTVENQSDLAVTIVDDGGAPVGQNFVYTVTITNNGPAVATNVTMTDTLDPTTSFVSATNGGSETSPGSGVVTATFASIGVGQSEVVEVTVVGSAEALVTNSVTVNGTEVDLNPGDNAASVDTLVGDFADIGVIVNVNDGYQTGGPAAFSVLVSNGGPNVATNVHLVITLDPLLDFVSGTGGATEIPPGSGNIEVTIPSIAVLGSTVININTSTTTSGAITITGFVDPNNADQQDPDDLNNTSVANTRVGAFNPIRAIYTEIDGHPSSIVPGALDEAGAPIVTEFKAIEDFVFNSDGTKWMVKGRTEAGSSIENILILGSSMTGTSFAQQGQPVPNGLGGELYSSFSTSPGPASFDSSDNIAYQISTTGGASTTDSKTIFYNATTMTHSILIQESDPLIGCVDIPANPSGDETRGSSTGSVFLRDDGQVWNAVTPIGNCSSTRYPAMLINNTAFRQSGVSMIQGFTWDTFGFGDCGGTPDGLHWFAEGETEEGSTAEDRILVVDDVIVVQEGFPIDGSALLAADIFWTSMLPSGDWFSRGDYSDDSDWALRNGVRVAQTGDPITVGSSETIGASIAGFSGNSVGDWILSCDTSETDPRYDAVLLLNDELVLAREGDPIDLDGNGLYDDNVFIGRGNNTLNPFQPNDLYIDNNRVVHFIASLRDGEGNDLGVFGTGGDAFLTIDLSGMGCGTIQGDAGGDGFRNGLDVEDFVNCILTGGSPTGACKCVDYDSDNDVDFADLSAFATQLVNDPA